MNEKIVYGREAGKTTYLLNAIKQKRNEGTNIVVLDSATEHEEKSLLKKIEQTYNNTITFDLKDERQIVLNKVGVDNFIMNYKKYYPYNQIIENRDKIICFDLSYFLELGHDIYDETNDIKLYKYYRELYNTLAEQIILVLILMERYDIIDNTVVVMDEIELPKNNNDIISLQEDLSFLVSVHPENAFGSFYESFDNAKFKPYVKRKE